MSYIADFRKTWFLFGSDMPLPDNNPLAAASLFSAEVAVPEGADLAAAYDIIGQYSAFIVVSYLDAAAAQALLPPHLMLATPGGIPGGKHPVMYSFGTHQGVRPRWWPLWRYDYAEALMGVPCIQVRHANGSTSGPFYYMTAVRLNNKFADEIGVALGFPKKLAYIDSGNTRYSIRMTPNGNPILTAAYQSAGGVFGPDYPNFQTIEQMVLQQPVISVAPTGSYLVTPFHIDTKTALMIPMTADITVADNSLAGMPAGHYKFAGINTTAFGGGYFSIHNWEMGKPGTIEI